MFVFIENTRFVWQQFFCTSIQTGSECLLHYTFQFKTIFFLNKMGKSFKMTQLELASIFSKMTLVLMKISV